VITFKKLAPVVYVEAIEPVLAFWEKLGFERTVEVPEGDALGFVILHKDGVEVMYQTRASVQADVPALADTPMRGSMLFFEVAKLDPVLDALEGVEHVVPRRQTFYGADEVFVRDPAGNLVGFAEFPQSPE
jgi:catechol 2,3-dioxygenase-like lactoylglutathione lyase family enzyme